MLAVLSQLLLDFAGVLRYNIFLAKGIFLKVHKFHFDSL